MVDFPSGVTATDPTQLLGANATVPAKQAINATGRALLNTTLLTFDGGTGALSITGRLSVLDTNAAVALGSGTTSAGYRSIAIGLDAVAGTSTNGGAIAIGKGAAAVGNGLTEGGSIGIGQQANGSGGQSIAIGYLAVASNLWSTALGRQATASGSQSMALGALSQATFAQSVALGNSAVTTKANQMVLGSPSNITEVNIPATTQATSPTSAAVVTAGGIGVAKDAVLSATSAIYLGDAATDGTWRYVRSGNDLLFQRREAGVWVTKLTIAA